MKKILIVEDDFIIKIFFTQIINNCGGNVVGTLSNCNNILSTINELKPDIVFMDIAIEGNINGIEATKLINANTNIPVVYITGNSDKKTMDEAKKTNPLYIIKKPVDEQALEDQIKIIYDKYNTIYV
ncbi:MAG: response regulator [Vicingaceae bacterium]|nr:response regulator [Vicingaceae bacterium]